MHLQCKGGSLVLLENSLRNEYTFATITLTQCTGRYEAEDYLVINASQVLVVLKSSPIDKLLIHHTHDRALGRP